MANTVLRNSQTEEDTSPISCCSLQLSSSLKSFVQPNATACHLFCHLCFWRWSPGGLWAAPQQGEPSETSMVNSLSLKSQIKLKLASESEIPKLGISEDYLELPWWVKINLLLLTKKQKCTSPMLQRTTLRRFKAGGETHSQLEDQLYTVTVLAV